MNTIRVVIVDDHALFCEGLTHALEAEPGIRVIAQHARVADAIATLSSRTAQVVLLDFDLGSERGGPLLLWAAEHGFCGRFLVVTAGLSSADTFWLIRHGVAGIFLKEHPFSDLVTAIRTVARGGSWLDQPFLKEVMESVVRGGPIERETITFTDRERLALRGVVEGLTNQEISERLEISESAVKATVRRLFEKTGARSRGHLTRVAIEKYRNYLQS